MTYQYDIDDLYLVCLSLRSLSDVTTEGLMPTQPKEMTPSFNEKDFQRIFIADFNSIDALP